MDHDFLPHVWQLDLTYECNADCSHCRNLGQPKQVVHSLKEWRAWLEPIFQRLGPALQWITLGGGEPLLLGNDLLLFVAWLRRYSPFVMLMTNGLLLDKLMANRLERGGINRIQVSLESGLAQEHDALRGAGSHAKALKAIRNCLEIGLPVAANTTLADQTPRGLETLADWLAETKVQEWSVRQIMPLGAAKNREVPSLGETRRQYGLVHGLAMARGLEIFSEDPLFWLHVPQNEWSPHWRGCHAGLSFMYCAPDGQLYPCSMLTRVPLGKLSEVDFWQIWAKHPALLALRAREYSGCSDCRLKPVCGGCQAVAGAGSLPLDGRPDPRCLVARNRQTRSRGHVG
jgi:radical SAM protein with 4Fe4S-binding SPASM domain